MNARVLLSSAVFLLAVGGCQDTSAPASAPNPRIANGASANSKLRGLIVVTPQKPDETVLFLGRRQNLKQQLDDVLAGTASDETWYMIRLATSKMPTAKTMTSYDLAKDAGIALTLRRPYPKPGPEIKQGWFTHEYRSTAVGVAGVLEVSGADHVANTKANQGARAPKNKWGVAFRLKYRGTLVVHGATIENASFDLTVGGLADHGQN